MAFNPDISRVSLVLCAAVFFVQHSARPAEACSPPLLGWHFIEFVPAQDEVAAPINGVVTARVAFVDPFGVETWPTEDEIARSVRVRLTRDGDEVVEGELIADEALQELRFVAERPLAEGITYTFEVALDNTSLDLPGDFVDETRRVSFTTGDRFDEAPPPFSGLQSVSMSQHPVAVRACCEATEDFCTSQCVAPCDWCWPVDYQYGPQAELSFRAVEDEFGTRTVSYAVFRLEDELAEPGAPVVIRRFDEVGPQVVRFAYAVEDRGPFCFMVRAFDVYGRQDANNTVICKTLDDIVPIEALEVPEPDRTFCLDDPDPEDAGIDAQDMGDAGVTPDAQAPEPDAVAPDAPDENEDEAPQVVSTPPGGGDGGCLCQTPSVPSAPGVPLSALLAAGLGAMALGRRRGA